MATVTTVADLDALLKATAGNPNSYTLPNGVTVKLPSTSEMLALREVMLRQESGGDIVPQLCEFGPTGARS